MITAKPGTCAEASMFAPPEAYIPCGKPAICKVEWPARGEGPVEMCEMCGEHNVKRRGAQYVKGCSPEEAKKS